MPRKTQSKFKSKTKSTKTPARVNHDEPKSSIWDIFKFGESYTSLILGIIVVVVATILLLTFVKGKNISAKQQNNISKSEQIKLSKRDNNISKIEESITVSPTKNDVSTTKYIQNKLIANKTNNTTNNVKITQSITDSSYTVKAGDTLWNIAENKYKSGYNWVDIKNANNISNPDTLFAGTKLVLPDVKAKIATVTTSPDISQKPTLVQTDKISANDYTINKGDTLWQIAVRAYGDGYAWKKIAQANKIVNPDLIHSGNKLTIPRG